MKGKLKKGIGFLFLLLLLISTTLKADTSQPSPPGLSAGKNSLAPASISLIALPANPGPSGDPKTNTFKFGQLSTPLQLSSQVKAFMLFDPVNDLQKISRFVRGTREVCPSHQGYQKQPSSGRLLLSLCILAYVLEKGPVTEYEALGISKDKSSNISGIDEKISVGQALAIAVTDFNTLSKEIYINQPERLEKPTPFISFVRENLIYLKKSERIFKSSNSQ
ncbi:MAG: hypothetical protein EXR74_01485 [Bdellovibrionales bacterium]|nr:hypothetical protein [Bdellovibrionales bacterium]